MAKPQRAHRTGLWMRLTGKRLSRRQRRLLQSLLVGCSVAGIVVLMQQVGLFASAQVQSADFLYDVDGDPGQDIVIVAIDEKSLQALGDWPLGLTPYTELFKLLQGAKVIGFDVLLPSAGPEGSVEGPELVEAVAELGTVVVPMAALEMSPPSPEAPLYAVGHPVYCFPALEEAAAASGSVNQPPDRDGTLRRVPLVVDAGSGESWEAFSLRILRIWLGLGDDAIASLGDDGYLRLGDKHETKYVVQTDEAGALLVNYVGRPGTFLTVSLAAVLSGEVPPQMFEDKIVLVGLMNALTEMDLHATPVSVQRMAGVEFQANVLHTLLNHRALVAQGQVGEIITVVVIALGMAFLLAQTGPALGALVAVLIVAGYLTLTSISFNQGIVLQVFYPLMTVVLGYLAVIATRFVSEQGERRQVTDTFGRFVSPEVRDVIVNLALEDPELIQPGGRQVELSVLFADIRGFTTLSENLEPSAVVEILNTYLDSMEAQVFAQGGTLDKYTGDGMMVLFGVPLEQPDHAERAVRAALAMQQAAEKVSRRRGEEAEQVVYGIGVTTGSAVVGHIGSSRRLDYTAIGDTVNLAARLEGVAPAGVILVNEATYRAVQHLFDFAGPVPATVKGKARPVPVYAVLGEREAV